MKLRNIIVLVVVFIALGGVAFYFANRTEPVAETEEPQVFVWRIDMDEIQHIAVQLPREGKGESFVKISGGDNSAWYFDNAQHSTVDTARWGAGIPLLLSGPQAGRIVAENASSETLAEYGLDQPLMEITLTLNDKSTLDIRVGDRTPSGGFYYVQAPGSNAVALVDYTWYDALARLVTEPPYASTTAG